MPDDPNQPRRDFGERLKDHIHDEINDRLDERMRRRREKMDRRMDKMERRMNRPHSPFGGVVVGVILAGFGVLLLLDNLGIGIFDRIWEWWPAILIVAGAARVVTACSWGARVWGSVLIFFGAVYLLNNLGFIHGNVWNFFWPVILIAVGVGMLARGFETGGIFARPTSSAGSVGGLSTSADDSNTLAMWAVFGGSRRRIDSQNFEGGEALAVFGGINIDLTKAGMQKEEVRVEANALFGGIDIRVPETWQVVVRGAGIFGGYEDKTWRAGATDEKKPRLIISGFAVFGGVVVKT
jgi:predicted membrane protein